MINDQINNTVVGELLSSFGGRKRERERVRDREEVREKERRKRGIR